MADIRLIVCDLDGTLLGSANEFYLFPVFRQKQSELVKSGVECAICTGRSLSSFKRMFAPMFTMGITAKYVIANHAFIYELHSFGYFPHILWNLKTLVVLWLSSLNTRQVLNEWHENMRNMSPDVRTLYRRDDRLAVRFGSEESAIAATNLLKSRLHEMRHLQVFRYREEVDIRPIPFTKGLAVTQLANRLNIEPANILTIGNGHNDISMFTPKVAAYCGCPLNSDAEVIEHVHAVGGHISSERVLAGVMDIISSVISDKVCSDLPTNWTPPTEGFNPRPHHKTHSKKKSFSLAQAFAVGLTMYAILAVFANYNLVPFGRFITLPFDLFIRLLGKLSALIV